MFGLAVPNRTRALLRVMLQSWEQSEKTAYRYYLHTAIAVQWESAAAFGKCHMEKVWVSKIY